MPSRQPPPSTKALHDRRVCSGAAGYSITFQLTEWPLHCTIIVDLDQLLAKAADVDAVHIVAAAFGFKFERVAR